MEIGKETLKMIRWAMKIRNKFSPKAESYADFLKEEEYVILNSSVEEGDNLLFKCIALRSIREELIHEDNVSLSVNSETVVETITKTTREIILHFNLSDEPMRKLIKSASTANLDEWIVYLDLLIEVHESCAELVLKRRKMWEEHYRKLPSNEIIIPK